MGKKPQRNMKRFTLGFRQPQTMGFSPFACEMFCLQETFVNEMNERDGPQPVDWEPVQINGPRAHAPNEAMDAGKIVMI
ncbi:MAG: hypothetical protein FWC84_00320 [Alphaproteobacteria bacterium]|nr:hypothetical protein [Alphaproteobacteria bacterium]